MSQELKDIIREEYIKCAQDPSHFMRKYCNIQHPQRGRIIFNLYPFQAKVLNLWQNNPFSIVLKSRQLGISTLAAGYSLWLMLFHKDKNILCIATKQDTAKNMVTKTKFMFDNLPSWLKIPADENNKLTLKLNNGSQIKATSAASDAGRSEAVSLLIIDEAAFIENIEPIWASAQQTLATGGGAIVLSTPFGTGNWFHKTWVRAESNENDSFLPIKLPWYVHPERDQAWRDKQDIELGDPRLAAQECDCDFSTSGDIVFYPEHLEYYLATHVVEPMERRGVDKNLWIWESPDYSRNYMVVADVARGDGKDYSAFHIFDLETNAQVAEYKSQLSPKEFGYMLVGIATEYNEALLVVENNNIGWATLDAIQEREYRNLYFSPKSNVITADSYFTKYENNASMIPGFTMSLRTRPLAINKGREYLGDHSVIIRSKRLIEEMKIFIWKNGRAEAQSGYNDDLIMSFNIAMFVRDTALKYKQQGIELTKATLNGIQRPADYQGAYFASGVDNPYAFKVNGESEDISWLLD
tara:strand:- start:1277 stop:2851 length:1575 start_codon:yes stop_codon:yes gene_type:complete